MKPYERRPWLGLYVFTAPLAALAATMVAMTGWPWAFLAPFVVGAWFLSARLLLYGV